VTPQARVDQTQPGRERFPPSGYVQGVMTPESARPAFCSVAQGALAGYEVRAYLLQKWERTCAYCGATGDVRLLWRHGCAFASRAHRAALTGRE
jgi:hypothetical protein